MKPIAQYEGRYSVADDGRVFSHVSQRFLKPQTVGSGYQQVNLGGKLHYVHRLVLESFVGPCPDGMECLHLNNDSLDNCLSNLCWGTHAMNVKQSHASGNRKHLNKFSDEQVLEMVRLYRDAGWTARRVAKKFGTGINYVAQVCRGEVRAELAERK